MSTIQRLMRVTIGVLLLLAVAAGCTNGLPTSVVTGSGTVTEQTFEIGNFSRLAFSAPGSLTIVKGERPSLVVSAQPNILENLEADVSGDTLQLRSARNVSLLPTADVRWMLTVVDLTQIDISGAGNVSAPTLTGDNVRLNLSGAGDVTLEGVDADRLLVEISGLGNINIQGGRADTLELTLTGAGGFDGTEVQTRTSEVSISGSGNARVRVSDTLDVNISGLGNVRYIGSPQISENISGLGAVEQIGR